MTIQEISIRLRFMRKMRRMLDLNNPRTFNEKLQWLKIHDHNPRYPSLIDKQEVKSYIEDKLGKEYVIPTLKVYETPDEINWDELPDRFVLKCTHDSGGVVVCRDKANFDKSNAMKRLWRHHRRNYYKHSKEWPYKMVRPRVIAEQYMEDRQGCGELRDFKFFCFDGEPKMLFVASDRQSKEETKFDFFDMDFNHLDITNGHPNATSEIEKPATFEQMKIIAAKLSEGFPHVRVDLYDIDGRIYFGELTFYHYSGMVPFKPAVWDETMGSWIKLPKPTNCE